MPRRSRGTGSVYRRGKTWWIKYYVEGRSVRESADTKDRDEAKRQLAEKLGQVARGEFIPDRVRLSELLDDVVSDYERNKKRSIKDVKRSIKVLKMYFGTKKAHSITPSDVQRFSDMRSKKIENSSVNRELSALKRAFNLGLENEKIFRKPKIKMLAENNTRTGFFEPAEFKAILSHLPDYLRAPMIFSYSTGWRVRSEVVRLTWSDIDLDRGTASLKIGTTKNKKARLIYLPLELRQLLTSLSKSDIGLVFHNHGKPIRNYYKAWRRACIAAGLPAKIPHDFRRTAVRNLVRQGVPEHTAMMVTGHRTRSVFDRYDIVDERDLEAAAEKMVTISGTEVSRYEENSDANPQKTSTSHPSSVGRATDS